MQNCPFRTDVPGYLSKGRAREIANALIKRDGTFSCRKLNEFEEDNDGNINVVEGNRAQHCAGALIFLESQGFANQLMRIAESIGCYDRTKLDMSAPVHKSASSFVAHHGGRKTAVSPAGA